MQRREGCHVNGGGRKRDFITATYRIETTGEWTTEIPTAAPCGPDCRIRYHDHRERLTGPCHPLLVVRCTVHDASFTVYPPGFTPHSRRPLVPRGERWEETMFEPAMDAAKGDRQSDIGEQGGWWSTQWRHILRLGLLLGLTSDDRVGQEAAQGLGIDLHLHLGARATFDRGGFRLRGGAIMEVLEVVRRAGADRLRRLLRTGFLTGYCGRCFWSDPRFGLTPVGAF